MYVDFYMGNLKEINSWKVLGRDTKIILKYQDESVRCGHRNKASVSIKCGKFLDQHMKYFISILHSTCCLPEWVFNSLHSFPRLPSVDNTGTSRSALRWTDAGRPFFMTDIREYTQSSAVGCVQFSVQCHYRPATRSWWMHIITRAGGDVILAPIPV